MWENRNETFQSFRRRLLTFPRAMNAFWAKIVGLSIHFVHDVYQKKWQSQIWITCILHNLQSVLDIKAFWYSFCNWILDTTSTLFRNIPFWLRPLNPCLLLMGALLMCSVKLAIPLSTISWVWPNIQCKSPVWTGPRKWSTFEKKSWSTSITLTGKISPWFHILIPKEWDMNQDIVTITHSSPSVHPIAYIKAYCDPLKSGYVIYHCDQHTPKECSSWNP